MPLRTIAVLSVTTAALSPVVGRCGQETATLDDGQLVRGQLTMAGDRVVFRSLTTVIEADRLARVDVSHLPNAAVDAPASTVGRLQMWDGQAFPGRVIDISDPSVRLEIAGHAAVSVPRAALASACGPMPTGRRQADLDMVVLETGDEIFGRLGQLTPESFNLEGRFGHAELDWTRVRHVLLRRQAPPTRSVAGLIVEVCCHRAPWSECRLIGALASLDSETLTLRHPFLGVISIPRPSVRSVVVKMIGTQVVVDLAYYHLGNEVRTDFLIAEPDGHELRMPFELSDVPSSDAILSCWVHDVEGIGSKYERLVEAGHLQTEVSLNGRSLGILNRHVRGTPREMAPVHLPVPDGILTPGVNSVAFLQTPRGAGESEFDDCGIQAVTIEFMQPSP